MELQNGDALAIPSKVQEVSILGEVNRATSHMYKDGLSLNDYVDMSGGTTAFADQKRAYVIKASGLVAANVGSRWFSKNETAIEPGDTIVMPMIVDKVRPMDVWKDVSQILFQLATTAAALEAVGVF